MNNKLVKKIIGWLTVAIILSLNFSPQAQNIRKYPENIVIFDGETKNIAIEFPFFVKVEAEDTEVVQFNGESLKDQNVYFLNNGIDISAGKAGNTNLNLSLLGFIPLKQINVSVSKEIVVRPGGEAIGVTLYTDGVLIVGTSDFEGEDGKLYCPAQKANMKPGDIIEKINGEKINDVKSLMEAIETGETLTIQLERDGIPFITELKPIYDPGDEQYHLGIWARDSTVGVGTLTFYNPTNQMFAALGHGICDIDTGTMLQVDDGSIVLSEIVDVVQGKKGEPGELRGVFDIKNKKIGDIVANTYKGLYGTGNVDIKNDLCDELIAVAHPEEVEVGQAIILSTIDDEGVKAFDIEIEKVNLHEISSGRGMVIRIVDEELIKKTGGVVQGMSGSPIIQNGKLIGAVTHVFVNDPEKGYGIFAEWMLLEMDNITKNK
jgi:stage IV sporulation protein B